MKNMKKFEKNKIYYYPFQDWKIKFIESHEGGLSVAGTHYVFKIMNDAEYDEFETTKPEEIFKTKIEYFKFLNLIKT